jgi:murein tripeptide amidase MpaA
LPARIDLWTIRTVNPDGIRAGTRKNARGVDLNRNFRFRFRRASLLAVMKSYGEFVHS